LEKSQVRVRYTCVRDISRSDCWPFCVHVSSQLEWMNACTLLIKTNCLVYIFYVSCVSVFITGGSLIPTIWGLSLGFCIPSKKGDPSPSPERCILLPGCGCPKVWLVTIFQICKWTWTPEFLDSAGKRALKTGTTMTVQVLCTNQDKKHQEGDQVMS
jgi:hypothetical protein